MLRRLHAEQPESFAFTSANQAWAEAQMTKYPEGRQASAIIPLLWRAQEQEGWLTRPAIEHVAEMLDMAYIRALEVATFYFMFQLQPVGSVAHIQICGTLSCMICGAEDLVATCREKIAAKPHELSADGKFSWEEVECLGACANAPMAQIGKDYYEDLTAEGLGALIDRMGRGEVPVPGPQNGRYTSEPISGLTSLTDHAEGRHAHNASVALAVGQGDTLKRIDGTEVPLVTPWTQAPAPTRTPPAAAPEAQAGPAAKAAPAAKPAATPAATNAEGAAKTRKAEASLSAKAGEASAAPKPTTKTGPAPTPAPNDATPEVPAKAAPSVEKKAAMKPAPTETPENSETASTEPQLLSAARAGGADDLKRISGVGPKLEGVLNEMGFWHFDQIADWGPGEIAWVDSRLKFKGRIERDDWVSQARALAAEK